MTDHETKIIIGSLLHDIGKVVYRKGMDVRKDIFTTEEAVFEIKRLLGQVAE